MLYSRSRSPQPPKRSYLPFIIATIVLLLIVLGLFFYETNRLPFWHRTTKSVVTHTAANNDAKGEPTSTGPGDQPNGGQPSDIKDGDSGASETLIAPLSTSTFVSAHHNVKVADTLSSTCTTTPGATCEIVFTKDGASPQSLPAETTDAGGTAYWNSWRPQDHGLTPGTWTVTAVAKLNTQTLSTEDASKLEIVQ